MLLLGDPRLLKVPPGPPQRALPFSPDLHTKLTQQAPSLVAPCLVKEEEEEEKK